MIQSHYENIKKQLGNSCCLCAVTKRRTVEEVMPLYEAGERDFAENRADELKHKYEAMPKDIRWHFIGHLQKNKVRTVLPMVSLIQSLDSPELARIIEKEAARIGRTVDVLVELHLAVEDTAKTGLTTEEADALIGQCMELPHVRVCGIMVMGPHTDDTERIREVFEEARTFYLKMQEKYGKETIHILSMGMSSDYAIALECGSDMVRIGTYLFEE